MHRLGLLPLVKKFQIHRRNIDLFIGFSPKHFDCFIRRHFFALTNVQELGIDFLDIPSFMPRVRRYFKHFLPTVRSLALREPIGSRRQIVYFIGLFQHLDDLKLLYDRAKFQREPADDHTLVPPFIPPLRGRLTMTHFTRVGLLEVMIELFGGLGFHHMDLFDVDGTRLLLDTCAKPLETLRLYPTDPRGKELSLNGVQMLADDFTAISSLRDFDLSRNKSLRTLEVRARYLFGTRLLEYALSTITSLVFSEVIAVYRDLDFSGVDWEWSNQALRPQSPAQRAKEASLHERQLKLFQAIHKVRDFQLVLCADVWDGVKGYTTLVLKRAVAAEKAKGGFDGVFPEPLVVYSPRGSRQDSRENWAGSPGPWIPL
jgi:hypothetical protein